MVDNDKTDTKGTGTSKISHPFNFQGLGHHERLLRVAMTSLGKRTGVCDVKVAEKPPVEIHDLNAWETKNHCTLPDELRSFYLAMDGLSVTWCTKVMDSKIYLGHMKINILAKLQQLNYFGSNKEEISVLDLDIDDDDNTSSGPSHPHFDNKSRIYELDPCDGNGKVCLVYRNTKPGVIASKTEIWFLDRAIRWHFLSDNFSAYYRLLLMHLGLPEWHYIFTDIGLSQQAKQWFNLYAPVRLEVDDDNFFDSTQSPHTCKQNPHLNQVDINRVFKGKNDKKKPVSTSATGTRKKPNQPSASLTAGARASAPNLANRNTLSGRLQKL